MLKDATNVPAKLATSDRDTRVVVAEATVADTRPAAPTGNLNISGDMRLRYEHNSSDGDERDDARGVVRGRIAATYAASPTLELGARLVTGDPDDPNSADVSLSNFNDDLQVSLDQIYGIKTFGKLSEPIPAHGSPLGWRCEPARLGSPLRGSRQWFDSHRG